MVLLVLGVAAAMRRVGNVRTKWLRGRALSVGRLRFHTNTRLAGTVTIVVGIFKLTTERLLTMPDLLSASMMEWISKIAIPDRRRASGPGLDRAARCAAAGLVDRRRAPAAVHSGHDCARRIVRRGNPRAKR